MKTRKLEPEINLALSLANLIAPICNPPVFINFHVHRTRTKKIRWFTVPIGQCSSWSKTGNGHKFAAKSVYWYNGSAATNLEIKKHLNIHYSCQRTSIGAISADHLVKNDGPLTSHSSLLVGTGWPRRAALGRIVGPARIGFTLVHSHIQIHISTSN